MIERLNSKNLNDLLKTIVIITLLITLFLILLNKFGGNITDYMTKKTCNMAHEKYVPGDKPGYGVCVKKDTKK
jgi:hypothetical protein